MRGVSNLAVAARPGRGLVLFSLIAIVGLLAPSEGTARSQEGAPVGPSQTATLQATSLRMPIKTPPPGMPDATGVSAPAATTTCVTNSAFNGFSPSGANGAAGPTNLVVVTNSNIQVWNKSTCAEVTASQTLLQFFAPIGAVAGELIVSPTVLYDPSVQRFFIAAFSCFTCTAGENQNLYLAVSKDNTANDWWLYTKPIVRKSDSTFFCIPTTGNRWDRTKTGSINGSNPRWLVVGNLLPNSGGGTTSLLSIDKAASLSGGAITVNCFPGLDFNTAATEVKDSGNVAYLLSPGTGSGNSIARYAFTPGAPDTIATTAAISVPAWTASFQAVQPGTIKTIGGGDGAFFWRTSQRGTSLWNVHAILSRQSGSTNYGTGRMYQFSTTGTAPLFTIDLFTGADDDIFNLSMAVNATKAFVTASRTIGSQATVGNPAMLMFSGPNSSATGWTSEVLATSAAPYTQCIISNNCRLGDPSGTQIDPTNTNRAWSINQLTGPANFADTNWATRAVLCCATAGAGPNTHDFDGNGKSDIVWRQAGGAAAVWLMNGAALASSASLGAIPLAWSIAGQRDFNGDGKHDLLWRDTSGNTAIWFMNGTTVSSTAAIGVVGTTWSIVGTGDFNGDSKADLLWRDNTGNTAIWLMNGAAVASSVGLGTIPVNWSVVGTADFDGDGNADILWHDSTGTTAIWFINGTAVSSTVSLGVIPTTWSVAATGDFNGDGNADILWRDTGGTTAIWLMNGASTLSSASLGVIPTTWTVAEAGDFNGDGKSDILWRDDTGATAIWFMNDTAVSSTASLGIIATTWTIQGVNAN